MNANSAPGFAENPNHFVKISPFSGQVLVKFRGEIIADSCNALSVQERGYNVVYYVPRGDVRMELAQRTDLSTTCPYKGDASYYTFIIGDARAVDAAWSYESPYDEVLSIKEYLAFYLNRVDVVTVP
ncbi:MAG: DUF427 domain-containing protein [Burkholderiales bacterium]|jgi:uncharacterized protein (DUF427 family)